MILFIKLYFLYVGQLGKWFDLSECSFQVQKIKIKKIANRMNQPFCIKNLDDCSNKCKKIPGTWWPEGIMPTGPRFTTQSCRLPVLKYNQQTNTFLSHLRYTFSPRTIDPTKEIKANCILAPILCKIYKSKN